MFNKTSKPQNRIDSLIGATTRIEGNVIFSGGLRVDGMVRGNVAALPDQPGTLVVSSEARIDGEIQAAHIVVNGTINGPVHATEYARTAGQGSRVTGDVYYKSIEIHSGRGRRGPPGASRPPKSKGGRAQARLRRIRQKEPR